MATRTVSFTVGLLTVNLDIDEMSTRGRSYRFRSTSGQGILPEPFRYEAVCSADEAWDLLEVALASSEILLGLLGLGDTRSPGSGPLESPRQTRPSLRLVRHK